MLAGKVDGPDDIRDARTAGNQRRPPVETRVPEPAHVLVGRVIRKQPLAVQTRREILDRGARQQQSAAFERYCFQRARIRDGGQAAKRPGSRQRETRADELAPSHGFPPAICGLRDFTPSGGSCQ
jgi:hypothetical protein